MINKKYEQNIARKKKQEPEARKNANNFDTLYAKQAHMLPNKSNIISI